MTVEEVKKFRNLGIGETIEFRGRILIISKGAGNCGECFLRIEAIVQY